MEIISLIACVGILIVLCVLNVEYRDLIRENAYQADQIISKLKELEEKVDKLSKQFSSFSD